MFEDLSLVQLKGNDLLEVISVLQGPSGVLFLLFLLGLVLALFLTLSFLLLLLILGLLAFSVGFHTYKLAGLLLRGCLVILERHIHLILVLEFTIDNVIILSQLFLFIFLVLVFRAH